MSDGKCVELEFPPLPDILPLTIPIPTLPTIDLSIDFCCRLAFSFDPGDIIAPLLPAWKALVISVPEVSATIALINANIAILNSYLDALPLSCPFDDAAED